MIELLNEYYQIFLKITRENQVVAGAVSLWGLTLVTLIFRTVPKQIFEQLKRSFIVSFTIDNTDYATENAMLAMFKHIDEDVKTWFSRSFMVSPAFSHSGISMMSLGYGYHYFFYKGALLWVHLQTLDSSGSEKQKKQVTLHKIGVSPQKLKMFFESFKQIPSERADITRASPLGYLDKVSTLPDINTSILALNNNVRNFIDTDLRLFLDNESWYRKRNLAYKLTTVLEGPPGTGKTSLIRAIAAELNRRVVLVNLSDIAPQGLQNLVLTGHNSVIVIEDFDDCQAVHQRENLSATKNVTPPDPEECAGDEKTTGVSLSAFLNILDGVASLDNVVIFLTTNHINKIDPAILRDGRVDKIIHVGALQPDVIKEYAQKLFPETDFSSVTFPEVVGCKIHTALKICGDDGLEFHRILAESADKNSNIG